jgi:DNA-binding NtrC family response regulator
MESDNKQWIIAVDDEPGILQDMKRVLRRYYRVDTYTDAREALSAIRSEGCPAVIVTDQRMPKMTGVEFLEKVHDLYPDAVGIFVTGFTQRTDLIGAINKAHAFAYLTKPWTPPDLLDTVERALRVRSGPSASDDFRSSLEVLSGELVDLAAVVVANSATLSQSCADMQRKLEALAERTGNRAELPGATDPSNRQA